MAEINTATEIQASFLVSALDAIRTLEFIFWPVRFKKIASEYFKNNPIIKITSVNGEYSVGSGVMIFSIASKIRWMPTAIIIIATKIVAARSILARDLSNLCEFANCSLIMMTNPETESIRLCTASDVIAREFDKNPARKLKIASRKFTAINNAPERIIIRLRVDLIDVVGVLPNFFVMIHPF